MAMSRLCFTKPNIMQLLENKVAIVTGGTRGIGRAIVETFVREGAKVVFTGRSTCPDEMANIENALFCQADIVSFAGAQKVADFTLEKFGRIDILVNNAGANRDTLLLRMSEEDWDDIIATDLKSVFNYVKAVQPTMLKQRAGSIISTGSVVGIGGNAGQANYAAAKAGIIGFSKSIAKELGSRNIRCNVVAPGLIDTLMTQKLPDEAKEAIIKGIALRRIGQAQDVANVMLFLASDLASYVTGQVIVCDGGM